MRMRRRMLISSAAHYVNVCCLCVSERVLPLYRRRCVHVCGNKREWLISCWYAMCCVCVYTGVIMCLYVQNS